MYYSILHKTRFRYSAPVSEHMSEVRMCPRSEGMQRCLQFELKTSPGARIHHYIDYFGNRVHHFDIPGQHRQLVITAEAIVVFTAPPILPTALGSAAWAELDALTNTENYWDFLAPSQFARPTPLLDALATELHVTRRADPFTVVRELNERMYSTFAYVPQSTTVDSQIDEALTSRQGVCQDYAHIMIALLRSIRVPARYVSGYLFHRIEDHDRSEQDATHAWIEALLPGMGWVGFDPTNNLIAGERHIRAAIGRDYADVPPTRGIYKGTAESTLEVGVKVIPTEAPIDDIEILPVASGVPEVAEDELQAQQQQQQQ